ncbi:MAG: hypothetical protein J6X02_03380 [Bacilli bacterium]|nr:hypothetical protein [Bacilli bacterium]
MKKKSTILLIIVLILVTITFVVSIIFNKKKDSVYLKISCKETNLSRTYKENENIVCNLLGEEYIFTVREISKDKVDLYSPNCLSTNGSNCPNNVEILKGKRVTLEPPKTDEVESMTIEW